MAEAELFGLVEAGGTKFVLGVSGPDRVLKATTRIPTTTPEETLSLMAAWFAENGANQFKAIGFGTFGPVELDRGDPHWGCILKTPKPGWTGADLLAPLRVFNVPIALDTDVNAAALAEARWGASEAIRNLIYVTIGTGIGGGAVVDGRCLSGFGHSEMGHIKLARHPEDSYPGYCPFHQDCIEGLAAGPSIKARWGASLSELPSDHPAHALEAFYIAHLCLGLRALFAPHRIVLGGGVMDTPGLLERVREAAFELEAGYFKGDVRGLIHAPALSPYSGLFGALALAMDIAE